MRAAAPMVLVLLVSLGTAAETKPSSDCADCPAMVAIPAHAFLMGSSPGDVSNVVKEGAKAEWLDDEIPQHAVHLKRFSISTTEVTRDQFAAFVAATGYQADGPCRVYSRQDRAVVESEANDWRNPGFRQSGSHPVVCVNWDDADAYVRWLSRKTGKTYRLPTEAEWEYVARAGTKSLRAWGPDNVAACRFANLADRDAVDAFGWDAKEQFPCRDGFTYTAPVAQFRANAFGLYDTFGNVREWVEDCYNASYNGAPTDGSAWLAGDCSQHMVRGGSWGNGVEVRIALRSWARAASRSDDRGFRVARSE